MIHRQYLYDKHSDQEIFKFDCGKILGKFGSDYEELLHCDIDCFVLHDDTLHQIVDYATDGKKEWTGFNYCPRE